MKRIFLLMIALSFLAFVGVAKAQQTLTVNDGTTTNEYVPIYGYYVDDYLRCQYVQPATDLSQMIGGTINSLTFYLSSPASASWGDANFQVYLKEVESTTISAFIDPATATTVYNGSLDGTQSTMTVTFSTPYTYTGGNLLIGFDNTVEGSWKRAYFYGVTATNACVQGYSSSSPSAVSPTQRNFLPKMDITYLPGDADPVVVESIEADDVTVGTGHTAQINYTVLPADAWYKQVSFASANTSIATVNQDGLVTAVAVGNTTVTITSTEYPAVSTTINVTVEQTYEIAIGEGTSTSNYFPTHTNYDYSYTQQIYTAEEMGVPSANLTSIAFKGSNSAVCDLDIYLVNTSKTVFSGTSDYIDIAEATLVFSGEVTFVANDWKTIEFSNPFAYTGDNLALIVDDNSGNWDYRTTYWSVYQTETTQSVYFYQDNTDINPSSPTANNKATSLFKDQVVFGYTPINVTPVESITADDITMMTGETAQITPTVLPADANQAVTYASANTNIATVSEDGLVTAVAAGTTTITITSVSTPEVSTTINVTVNPNPDNVVFTVNAPATAQPGDVITVEAYLNAPTSGNYNGFTGLVLGLHFDTEAFEPYGNPVKGPVAETSTMSMPALPNESHPDHVQMSCVMPVGTPNTTTGLVFSMQFTVLAETGSYDFYAEPTWASETVSNFVNNPGTGGVNIPYEVTPSTVAVGLITLDITGYGESAGGYYLIASPIGEVSPANVGSMLDNEYDLYYFDQAQDLEWINYEGPDGNFSLQPGKGYLYANQEDVTLTFTGTPYSGDGTVELVYDNNAVDFKGWNLVGNPFNEIAYLADGRDFYVMQSDGSEIIAGEDDAINPMQGIFVIAEEDGETVTFTTEQPNKKIARLALNLSNGRSVIDRAIVRFGEGRQLPKFQISRNSTKVYIPMDGSDFAVVRSQGVGEIPVNFKAEKSGSYSLSFSTENVEMAYLHLIDNLTGKDVDLLSTSSYSFEASSSDYESRFKLVFATGHNDGETFAYFNNGSFVINNEGEAILQVVDVTGRILSNETISGSISKNIQAAPGVYMLRIVKDNDVKVQKIVVE